MTTEATPGALGSNDQLGPAAEACDHCDGIGKVDDYGNPLSGDRIIYCCFPDCGCDGSRCCMAENGPSFGAIQLNLDRGLLGFPSRKQAQ